MRSRKRNESPEIDLVADDVGPLVRIEEQSPHLFEREGPGSEAAEHGDLAAGFVDGAIPIEPFG